MAIGHSTKEHLKEALRKRWIEYLESPPRNNWEVENLNRENYKTGKTLSEMYTRWKGNKIKLHI